MTRSTAARASKLTVGKLGQLAGVTADTVRFYERAGLLNNAQRTASGYRIYGMDDVDRVRFIRGARGLGFSLEEVRQLLAVDDGGDDAHIREAAQRRLSEIDRRLAEITRVREALLALVHGEGPATPGRTSLIRALVAKL